MNWYSTLLQGMGSVEYTDWSYPHTPDECCRYDTKQSDGEVSVMLELLGMLCTPSSPWLPGPLWCGEAASDRVLSLGLIELNCVLMLN